MFFSSFIQLRIRPGGDTSFETFLPRDDDCSEEERWRGPRKSGHGRHWPNQLRPNRLWPAVGLTDFSQTDFGQFWPVLVFFVSTDFGQTDFG